MVPYTMKNDLWSNYPETQFGPTYPFFWNPEPRPTLRAVKVHFDWTWILRLKRFFLREFSSKIILINHPPIWDEFLIFKCIMGQSKKKWKMKKHDSRVKTRKGSLERKRNLKRLMGGARKWMKGRQPGSIWNLHGFLNPFQNRRIWTFYLIIHVNAPFCLDYLFD